MNDLKYRLYCFLHHTVKKILKREILTVGEAFSSLPIQLGVEANLAPRFWRAFIENSLIPQSLEYEGIFYAGYIGEKQKWCLPSWIWTNASIVRMFCSIGEFEAAKNLAENLLARQQPCGGWVVRNDYDKQGAIPMLAPNDSAYIANNAFLVLYLSTKERKYLDVALRCADWIIETARPDGIVYTGYNMRDSKWVEKCVIVDVGFTAGLFARLVEITKEKKYQNFLKRFVEKYIELFFMSSTGGFCTSINENNQQQGGMFGRGQAWALEGLIPAYKILKDEYVKQVVESTINCLIKSQRKNGSWAYNFTRPLMGEDCKAVSVIAKNMMGWYEVTKDERIRHSANKALDWCYKHTSTEGVAKGGIFSFCMEGAIVQNLYTSCAFVYSSAYAVELEQMLK